MVLITMINNIANLYRKERMTILDITQSKHFSLDVPTPVINHIYMQCFNYVRSLMNSLQVLRM